MACSPKRPDPLRDAEARVRALTREVGTLREDLRRETKKRERAVAQAKEHEEARRDSEARSTELAYSNRKLTGELDALHEAARGAAERDRRALRALREGLAAVEEAVAGRTRKGYVHLRALHEAHQQLRLLLFGGPSLSAAAAASSSSCCDPLLRNIAGLSAAAVPRAEQLLGVAAAAAEALTALLAGDGDVGVEEEGSEAGGRGHGEAAAAGAAGLLAAVSDAERDREVLIAEVVRLRGELRAAEERAAASGANSVTALELQHSLAEAQGELARLRAELVHRNAEAAAAAREQAAMAEALHEARQRLLAQDELQGALVAAARQQEDSSLGLVADLTAGKVALEGEVASLHQQVAALRQQVSEALSERQALEAVLQQREQELRAAKASIMETGADIRSALSLIVRPPPAAATTTSGVAPAGGPPPGPTSTSALLALQQAATAAPQAACSEAGVLESALAAALAPYSNARAAIGSALAAAAAILPGTTITASETAAATAGPTAACGRAPPSVTAGVSGVPLGSVLPHPHHTVQLAQPAPSTTAAQQALADLTTVLGHGHGVMARALGGAAGGGDVAGPLALRHGAGGAAVGSYAVPRDEDRSTALLREMLTQLRPQHGASGNPTTAMGGGEAAAATGSSSVRPGPGRAESAGPRLAGGGPLVMEAADSRRAAAAGIGGGGVYNADLLERSRSAGPRSPGNGSGGTRPGPVGRVVGEEAGWRPGANRRMVGGEGLFAHAAQGRDLQGGGWQEGGGVGVRRVGGGNRLAALRKDMQSLDEEIAQMEASLAAAARRTS